MLRVRFDQALSAKNKKTPGRNLPGVFLFVMTYEVKSKGESSDGFVLIVIGTAPFLDWSGRVVTRSQQQKYHLTIIKWHIITHLNPYIW